MHFYLFFFGWRIMPVHHLPMIMAKVSNEQRKEKEVKRQDWKGKRRAHRQLLDQTFCSVGCCHHQSTGRKGKGTEFTKVRSSESACKCRRPRFDSWVRKILWRREQLPTSVFCPGEFHGLYSPRGRKESDATERFSLSRSSGSHRDFRVNGKWELPVTAPETLGLWLIEDYARWPVCTSVTLPCLWGVLCISCSELKPWIFLWDKLLTRLS